MYYGYRMCMYHARSTCMYQEIAHDWTTIYIHACTMIIVHACTMIILHACTMIIVQALTLIIVRACTMIIAHACTMIIVKQKCIILQVILWSKGTTRWFCQTARCHPVILYLSPSMSCCVCHPAKIGPAWHLPGITVDELIIRDSVSEQVNHSSEKLQKGPKIW